VRRARREKPLSASRRQWAPCCKDRNIHILSLRALRHLRDFCVK
jgi:hypothetical protein